MTKLPYIDCALNSNLTTSSDIRFKCFTTEFYYFQTYAINSAKLHWLKHRLLSIPFNFMLLFSALININTIKTSIRYITDIQCVM